MAWVQKVRPQAASGRPVSGGQAPRALPGQPCASCKPPPLPSDMPSVPPCRGAYRAMIPCTKVRHAVYTRPSFTEGTIVDLAQGDAGEAYAEVA